MSEQVQTGGLMQFRYSKQRDLELDPERKDAIEIGYAEYDDRKKKERKNKLIFWIIFILLIILIIGYFLLKN